MEPDLREVGGSSWKPLSPSPSPAGGHLSHSQDSQPESHPFPELTAPLQSLDLEEWQGKQDSRDVVCGICMDKVWDKPEAERVFGILPNCTHAHCLGCLRTWRKNHQNLPLNVIKACPQCRVHSSYMIPHKFWVGEGPKKEQLIRNFKAWTSQIPCRFFMRGRGRCPFKSDCIYLHQLPAKTPVSGPPWPDSVQLVSGSKFQVLGPALFLRGHQARRGYVLHRLCPGSGSLRFRTPARSQQFSMACYTRIGWRRWDEGKGWWFFPLWGLVVGKSSQPFTPVNHSSDTTEGHRNGGWLLE
nr:probable E3 ubiquitin-protein ligase makorin-3 [Marmota flaviventris]